MMLGMLAGAALRSVVLAAVVGSGLRLRRTHNPRVSLMVWTLVLAASLSMPIVTQLASIAPPLATIPLPLVQTEISGFITYPQQTLSAALPAPVNWHWLGLFLYLAVFGVLMLRLLAGLWLSWRIVRNARPIHATWCGGFDIRVSHQIGAPATFGSIILLPIDHVAWPPAKRLAVLAHEGAHVARCDFALLLAAAVNRLVFWFNPFSWWLQRHLADLAEAASDAAAIAELRDRVLYAEILLELSSRIPALPNAVAMARRAAVIARIERILSGTPMPASMTRGCRLATVAGFIPVALLVACLIVSPVSLPAAQAPPAARLARAEAAPPAKQPIQTYPLATMMPKMALASDVPSVRNPDPPPASPHRMSEPVPMVRHASRSSPHPTTTTKAASVAALRPVDPVRTDARVAMTQVAATQEVRQDGRPPWFENLVNTTCGVTDILRLGPAYVNSKGPAYLVQTHFFRSRDGRPWVTLYYTGGQVANLPVMITETEIRFTRSDALKYTLSPSPDSHLAGLARHPDGASVDFACWRETLDHW